jgi:hypothetical protein
MINNIACAPCFLWYVLRVLTLSFLFFILFLGMEIRDFTFWLALLFVSGTRTIPAVSVHNLTGTNQGAHGIEGLFGTV